MTIILVPETMQKRGFYLRHSIQGAHLEHSAFSKAILNAFIDLVPT